MFNDLLTQALFLCIYGSTLQITHLMFLQSCLSVDSYVSPNLLLVAEEPGHYDLDPMTRFLSGSLDHDSEDCAGTTCRRSPPTIYPDSNLPKGLRRASVESTKTSTEGD